MSEFYIGLMSGASLDGVDAALVDFAQDPGALVATHFVPYREAIRVDALALSTPGHDELERAAALANRLAELYAIAVHGLLEGAAVPPARVAAIGCHGQTVRHRPDRGYTTQLVNAALLAERSGIRVVADFRSRDVAAGGQGAPLVPAFHAARFGTQDLHRVIVNIGGIANITDLRPEAPVRGFDTGPGNVLLDMWMQRHMGATFDRGGAWGASGTPIDQLLQAMRSDPYFSVAPPKSTGPERFNAAWLASFAPERFAPRDVQATLAALTASTIADAVTRFCNAAEEVLICGGGAANVGVMEELTRRLPSVRVATTAVSGVDPDWVEAIAFAWLARQTLLGRASNLPEVTGAAGPRVLGAIYPT